MEKELEKELFFVYDMGQREESMFMPVWFHVAGLALGLIVALVGGFDLMPEPKGGQFMPNHRLLQATRIRDAAILREGGPQAFKRNALTKISMGLLVAAECTYLLLRTYHIL